jgi:hypothetical protein
MLAHGEAGAAVLIGTKLMYDAVSQCPAPDRPVKRFVSAVLAGRTVAPARLDAPRARVASGRSNTRLPNLDADRAKCHRGANASVYAIPPAANPGWFNGLAQFAARVQIVPTCV